MSLEDRLTLSESLANKNNEAALSTSEQLMKANQIISKQNADLIEMKDKVNKIYTKNSYFALEFKILYCLNKHMINILNKTTSQTKNFHTLYLYQNISNIYYIFCFIIYYVLL